MHIHSGESVTDHKMIFNTSNLDRKKNNLNTVPYYITSFSIWGGAGDSYSIKTVTNKHKTNK